MGDGYTDKLVMSKSIFNVKVFALAGGDHSVEHEVEHAPQTLRSLHYV